MSNTPKSKRKDHDFNTTKEMVALRREITELAINRFGYDRDRYSRQIERWAEVRKNDPNVMKAVEKMRERQNGFFDGFIKFETAEVLKIWRNITAEFERGNAIFPSGEALAAEYTERRLHFDRCIGHIFDLMVEMEYIAETLPVDKNRYDNLAGRIKNLSKMVKGVRRSSNRFLKALPADADKQGSL